jgi:hypothetical protein
VRPKADPTDEHPAPKPTRLGRIERSDHMRRDPAADALACRVRGAYLEMPGLQLTSSQAARLLGLEPGACAVLLDRLMAEGFLRQSTRGRYVRVEAR